MIEFSGTNRSYCYVRYTKQEEAREAIKRLNSFQIRSGYPLAVTRSVDNRKLCVKAMPALDRETEEEVVLELSNVVEGVDKVRFQTRGWLEVEFSTHRLAALARRQLVPGNVVMFERVEIKQVDWADPEEDSVGQDSEGKVICVRNVPSSTTHLRVGDVFNNLSGGQVANVVKSRNTVLVTFTTQEGAKFAMESSCNLELDGSKLEVNWWSNKRLDRDSYSSQPRSVHSLHPAGPVEHLHQVCTGQGWGAPQYTLIGTRLDQVTGQQLYQGGVMVPGVSHSQIRGDWSVDRQLARVSAAIRAMQGIVQASRQLYTAQVQGAHYQPQPPHPPQNLQFTPTNYTTQFLPPPTSQSLPPPARYYLHSTSLPPPPPGFPLPKYKPTIPPPTTRPNSILVSRPDSPKPVLAVPPVHRATSLTSLASGHLWH